MTNKYSTSSLRQRMIEDMTMRKLSPKTQSGYIRAVKNLTRFLGRSPATATAEDLRRFQLHLVKGGVSSITINATITGLRFFFAVTLERSNAMAKMSHVHEPRKLPIVLSAQEVERVIEAAGSLKYKAALSIAYGAGLRASEVVHLKVSDIDSERMVLRVEQGKGKKDRYAMLSPPAATAIARSVRPVRRSVGWKPVRLTCCRWSITTWSSPYPHRSATSPIRIRR